MNETPEPDERIGQWQNRTKMAPLPRAWAETSEKDEGFGPQQLPEPPPLPETDNRPCRDIPAYDSLGRTIDWPEKHGTKPK